MSTLTISRTREDPLRQLSASVTMLALCVMAIALFQSKGSWYPTLIVADDMLSSSALLFLLCAVVFFRASRSYVAKPAAFLATLGDALFIVAVTIMIATGFVLAYPV